MSTGGLRVYSKNHFDPISVGELKNQIDEWNKNRDIEMVECTESIEYGKLENVGVAYEEEQNDVIKHSQTKPEIDFGIFE